MIQQQEFISKTMAQEAKLDLMPWKISMENAIL